MDFLKKVSSGTQSLNIIIQILFASSGLILPSLIPAVGGLFRPSALVISLLPLSLKLTSKLIYKAYYGSVVQQKQTEAIIKMNTNMMLFSNQITQLNSELTRFVSLTNFNHHLTQGQLTQQRKLLDHEGELIEQLMCNISKLGKIQIGSINSLKTEFILGEKRIIDHLPYFNELNKMNELINELMNKMIKIEPQNQTTLQELIQELHQSNIQLTESMTCEWHQQQDLIQEQLNKLDLILEQNSLDSNPI